MMPTCNSLIYKEKMWGVAEERKNRGAKLPVSEVDNPYVPVCAMRQAASDLAEIQPMSLLTLERSSATGMGFAT